MFPDQVLSKEMLASDTNNIVYDGANGKQKININKFQFNKIKLGLTVLYRIPSGTEKLSTNNYYSFLEEEAWFENGKSIKENMSDSNEGFFSNRKDIPSYSKTFRKTSIIKGDVTPIGVMMSPIIESDILSENTSKPTPTEKNHKH